MADSNRQWAESTQREPTAKRDWEEAWVSNLTIVSRHPRIPRRHFLQMDIFCYPFLMSGISDSFETDKENYNIFHYFQLQTVGVSDTV
jgi:hypothetical protein